MPAKLLHRLPATMWQHDFEGNRLFQHRNRDKWNLAGSNRVIDGFIAEDQCRRFLEELRPLWSGRVQWNETLTQFEKHILAQVCRNDYEYVRAGHDSRLLEFKEDRTIGRGAGAREKMWSVTCSDGGLSLVLFGENEPTCRLTPQQGIWQGHWYRQERMAIQLKPLAQVVS